MIEQVKTSQLFRCTCSPLNRAPGRVRFRSESRHVADTFTAFRRALAIFDWS